MNDIQLLERLNKSTQDDLKSLTGVGSVLAERLVAARPFATLDEVAAVKGINPSLFAHWMETSVPFVETEPAPVPEVDAQPEKTVNDEPSPAAEDEKKRKQAPRPRAEISIPFKKVGTWENFSAYLLTSIASIILTLAILGGINGGLRFARNAEYQASSQELAQLSTDVTALQTDITGLRSRVDTLDGLTDRTMSIEEKQAELTEALDAATKELASVQDDLNALDEKVNQQDERTLRFEGFLENLQQNLNELFATDGSES